MAEMKDRFQIKGFILYLLKNIREPLEYKIINDMVMQDGFVSGRDFPICFCINFLFLIDRPNLL
mgnify:CR=1 FL=1